MNKYNRQYLLRLCALVNTEVVLVNRDVDPTDLTHVYSWSVIGGLFKAGRRVFRVTGKDPGWGFWHETTFHVKWVKCIYENVIIVEPSKKKGG